MDSKITGTEGLVNQLRSISQKMRKKVLRGAVGAAARPIIKDARSRIHDDTRNLRRSIGTTSARAKSPYEFRVHVSPRRGGAYNGYYGKFVEFGHSTPHGGWVAAHPFMRPAIESQGDAALSAAKAYIAKRIPTLVSKG